MKTWLRPLLTLVVIGGLILISLSCGQNANTSLSIAFTPSNPTLIPKGSPTVGNGTVTEPYLLFTRIHMTWNGSDRADIGAIIIKFTETSSGKETTCSLSSTDISTNFKDGDGTATYSLNPPAVGGTPTTLTSNAGTMLGCGGIAVAEPDADGYSILGTARVLGSTVNPTSLETTGRIGVTAFINVR